MYNEVCSSLILENVSLSVIFAMNAKLKWLAS